MREQVERALERIRPMLRRDGGDLELVDVTDEGVVKVRLIGACGFCPMAEMTLNEGIERQLKKAVPAVTHVEAVPTFPSSDW